MKNNKPDLLDFLAEASKRGTRVPSIPELSEQLGMNVAAVREQLEVARQLGIVEVKPKVGIQLHAFDLSKPLGMCLKYGLSVEPDLFDHFADLRRHLEMSYWYEAVPKLTRKDIEVLQAIVDAALAKIRQQPVEIPLDEHRDLHLLIYRHLDNPIVISMLETYWDLYSQTAASRYYDRDSLEVIWVQHQKMVSALAARQFEQGFEVMVAHMDLLQSVKKAEINQRFE
ncbi:MAG TPA: FCD domain-containing protein [Anaerolineaceae bacterium]|jgi:DNA-binding FadR family transcriptional regulator|nr:FCD domain-containing protein [Anaerolineaceae bacterium]